MTPTFADAERLLREWKELQARTNAVHAQLLEVLTALGLPLPAAAASQPAAIQSAQPVGTMKAAGSGSWVWTVLEAMYRAQRPVTAQDMDSLLPPSPGKTEEQRLKSIRSAFVYLRDDGFAVQVDRGIWKLTEAGVNAAEGRKEAA